MGRVVVRPAEIAAPEVAAALPDLTLVSDVEIEPVVEVMSVSDSIVTDELSDYILPGEYLDGISDE